MLVEDDMSSGTGDPALGEVGERQVLSSSRIIMNCLCPPEIVFSSCLGFIPAL